MQLIGDFQPHERVRERGAGLGVKIGGIEGHGDSGGLGGIVGLAGAEGVGAAGFSGA